MKKLFLMRHAEAGNDASDDIGRGLTPAGEAEALAVGSLLAQSGFVPDMVFCSSARRTLLTAELVSRRAGFSGETPAVIHSASGLSASGENFRIEPRLYRIDGDELLEFLDELSFHGGNILLVGHNPSVSECAFLLGESSYMLRPAEGFLLENRGGDLAVISKVSPGNYR